MPPRGPWNTSRPRSSRSPVATRADAIGHKSGVGDRRGVKDRPEFDDVRDLLEFEFDDVRDRFGVEDRSEFEFDDDVFRDRFDVALDDRFDEFDEFFDPSDLDDAPDDVLAGAARFAGRFESDEGAGRFGAASGGTCRFGAMPTRRFFESVIPGTKLFPLT